MKKLMLITAIVLGTVAFTGCGNSNDGANQGSDGTSTEMGTDVDSSMTPSIDTTTTDSMP